MNAIYEMINSLNTPNGHRVAVENVPGTGNDNDSVAVGFGELLVDILKNGSKNEIVDIKGIPKLSDIITIPDSVSSVIPIDPKIGESIGIDDMLNLFSVDADEKSEKRPKTDNGAHSLDSMYALVQTLFMTPSQELPVQPANTFAQSKESIDDRVIEDNSNQRYSDDNVVAEAGSTGIKSTQYSAETLIRLQSETARVDTVGAISQPGETFVKSVVQGLDKDDNQTQRNKESDNDSVSELPSIQPDTALQSTLQVPSTSNYTKTEVPVFGKTDVQLETHNQPGVISKSESYNSTDVGALSKELRSTNLVKETKAISSETFKTNEIPVSDSVLTSSKEAAVSNGRQARLFQNPSVDNDKPVQVMTETSIPTVSLETDRKVANETVPKIGEKIKPSGFTDLEGQADVMHPTITGVKVHTDVADISKPVLDKTHLQREMGFQNQDNTRFTQSDDKSGDHEVKLKEGNRANSHNYEMYAEQVGDRKSQADIQAVSVSKAQEAESNRPTYVKNQSIHLSNRQNLMRLNDLKGSEMTVNITPPSLGELRVRVEVYNGVVRADLHAENQASGDLIAKSLNSLRDNLISSGLDVGSLNVSVDQQGNGGYHPQQQPKWRSSSSLPATRNDDQGLDSAIIPESGMQNSRWFVNRTV